MFGGKVPNGTGKGLEGSVVGGGRRVVTPLVGSSRKNSPVVTTRARLPAPKDIASTGLPIATSCLVCAFRSKMLKPPFAVAVPKLSYPPTTRYRPFGDNATA